MTADEVLAMVKSRRDPTPYRRRYREAWGEWLMALLLTAACGLLTTRAIVCEARLLLPVGGAIALPALWQLAGAAYRLHLLWHLAPARHAPARHARYAERLQQADERRARRRQRLQRRHALPLEPRRLLLSANGMALCGCLLLTLTLWPQPSHALADGSKSCAYVLCNDDCAELQMMDEVAGLFARA